MISAKVSLTTDESAFKPLSTNPKMVKHTQTIRWQEVTNCLSVFDHFAGLVLNGLKFGTLKILW